MTLRPSRCAEIEMELYLFWHMARELRWAANRPDCNSLLIAELLDECAGFEINTTSAVLRLRCAELRSSVALALGAKAGTA